MPDKKPKPLPPSLAKFGGRSVLVPSNKGRAIVVLNHGQKAETPRTEPRPESLDVDSAAKAEVIARQRKKTKPQVQRAENEPGCDAAVDSGE